MVADTPRSRTGSDRIGRHTLCRSGSQVNYWVSGPEDAPLVAFTHGATMDHRMFDPQVKPLVAAGYRVLTWDIRGHGYSKPIGGDFSVRAVVADLLAILDELGCEKAALVGQSFGGYVAQELTFRRPERVRALCVIGSTDVTQIPPRLEYAALRLSTHLFRIWPTTHLRKTIAKNTAETEAVRKYAYSAASGLSKREFLTVWRAVATGLHAEPCYSVPMALLITHGDRDRAGTVARDAPSWAEREPNARYETIPDAGHNANQDSPDEFNRVLLDFLREHVPA